MVAALLAVAAFVVTLLGTGRASSGPNPSGFISANVSDLRSGIVESRVEPIAAIDNAEWPVFLVGEANGHVNAFLARGPLMQCRVVVVPPIDRLTYQGTPLPFQDPCGGGYYTLSGRCISGPCSRGLDQFPLVVTRGQARIDLNTLIPGVPRTP